MLQLLLLLSLLAAAVVMTVSDSCSGTSSTTRTGAPYGVVTSPSQSKYLEVITGADDIHNSANYDGPRLVFNSSQTFQSVQGFGYSLTGGSAGHLMGMDTQSRNELLKVLFEEIKINTLRLPIGSSDLDTDPFSYDDLPYGVSEDRDLLHFSMDRDRQHRIPVLKEIVKIQPNLTLWATPWSAPSWMKDNNATVGGSLLPPYYETYAKYLVKYMLEMAAEALPINYMTVQNEPANGHNNPSMVMNASDQGIFIRDFLAPAMVDAGIATWDGTTFVSGTKIIIFDHNADSIGYPLDILNDATIKPFIGGSAFHLYSGDISSLTQVHIAHPDRDIHFTEQWVSNEGDAEYDLLWHSQNILIGGLNNFARTVLEWNLSSNRHLTPHTDGGCTKCLGAVTIDGSSVTRNTAFYVVAHASQFLVPGSTRITSYWDNDTASTSMESTIDHVVFLTPDDKVVLLLTNRGYEDTAIAIADREDRLHATLLARSLTTFVL